MGEELGAAVFVGVPGRVGEESGGATAVGVLVRVGEELGEAVAVGVRVGVAVNVGVEVELADGEFPPITRGKKTCGVNCTGKAPACDKTNQRITTANPDPPR